MNLRRILTSLALLLLATPILAQDTVEVGKVTSGTTFTTSTGEKIILLGVGTPKSAVVDAEDIRTHLAILIEGQTVVLVADSLLPVRKGTRHCWVYAGGELINLRMVASGYASALKTPKHSKLAELMAAEKEARAEQSGAWSTERSSAVQCSGTTKKGSRCLRMTTNPSGKCWQHE